MTSPLLAALDSRVLVLDGAMGATLQNIDLSVDADYLGRENCVDVLVRSRPELIQSIHESFLEAGADAVETNTFGANRLVLGEFDEELVGWTRALNREAAEIARAACDAHASPESPRFVVGSMGPGTRLLTLGQTTWATMLDSYAEQARGLLDGGVDAMLIETCQDLLQVKCAVNACLVALEEAGRSAEDVPIMVSVTIETTGAMLLGTEISAAASALRGYPIASLGLNCATGPTEMAEHVAWLAAHWDRPISVLPNAGLPVLVEGKSAFPLQPGPFADALHRFVEAHGVNIVGGCCGTTPEHIRHLAERVGRHAPVDRPEVSITPGCTSLYAPVDYRQESSFLIVGERMNASGSRKFKRLLEAEAWDDIVSLAREQRREGACVLDINVDYAGRDNARDMAEIVGRVTQQVDVPLMVDSTQPATIEAGLCRTAGKAIINSANFEDGEEKFDEICGLARRYGAALVIGTIDEDPEAAMARTAERKYAIAARAIERATTVHGLDVGDLHIDPLVLPISTGMDSDRRSGLELINGTRAIATGFPGCQQVCGLSNVSFGLKPAARVVLNSVLLHELLGAGMTGAIVHASKILPLAQIPADQRSAALDLIFDRRAEAAGGTGLPDGVTEADHDPLQAFIDLFQSVEGTMDNGAEPPVRTLEQWLRDHIIDGEKQGLDERLDEALARYTPLEIINEHLLEGMQVVGELFGSGEMQLPFVLQSAEVMKMAVAHLEPHMDRVAGETRGTIVLATVKGDVHDIGKNLVDIILSNNGYTVHNLGIKQPISRIVEAYREHGADAIGMSGLLVKSVMVMEEYLGELNRMGVDAPVLLGGAALSRHYAESHLRGVYDGPVYYGKDAFDGLRICDRLANDALDEIDREIDERLAKRKAVERQVSDMRTRDEAAAESGDVAVAVRPVKAVAEVAVPAAPFFGVRVVDDLDLDDVYPYINTVALFRGQWGFKRGSRSPEAYAAELEEVVQPIFERLKNECRDGRILEPKVVYGFFPCLRDGDDLVVFDPQSDEAGERREIERFSFPRQTGRRSMCISDFFRSEETRPYDVVGFQCVTMGAEVSRRAAQLFVRNEYTEYLYMHGMGVECAEALAEMWHKRMRAELGIGGDDSPRIRDLFSQKYRGSRYSFGYPACPEMSDQEKLFRLLEPDRIGCMLTENWQIEPEQSTSAIIVHHPEAKYFNV